jgi:hypothetical protein
VRAAARGTALAKKPSEQSANPITMARVRGVENDTKAADRLLDELIKLQQDLRTLGLRDTRALEEFRRKIVAFKAKVDAHKSRRDGAS